MIRESKDTATAVLEPRRKEFSLIESNGKGDEDTFDMNEFEYDPYKAALPTTTAKLIFNAYEESTEEYNAKSGKPAVPQWVMTFEDGIFTDWEDASIPRTLYNRVNLAYWRDLESDDKEATLVNHGKHSTPVKFAEACDKDHDFHPRNEELVGQWFEMQRMEFGEDPYIKKMWVPVKCLGSEMPANVLTAQAKREESAVGFK